MALILDEMKEETYNYHVNEDKNDFKNWIVDVFGENKLGEKINVVTDKSQMQLILLKHLVGGK